MLSARKNLLGKELTNKNLWRRRKRTRWLLIASFTRKSKEGLATLTRQSTTECKRREKITIKSSSNCFSWRTLDCNKKIKLKGNNTSNSSKSKEFKKSRSVCLSKRNTNSLKGMDQMWSSKLMSAKSSEINPISNTCRSKHKSEAILISNGSMSSRFTNANLLISTSSTLTKSIRRRSDAKRSCFELEVAVKFCNS